MAGSVKLGLVGTSWWSDWLHLPSLASHPRAEIAAICGRSRQSAEAMAAKYHVARTYTNYREMISSGELDAIAIASPDDTHHEIALLALDHGLHVLCEKPLANSLDQAEQMSSLAEEVGVIHMTHFTWRWAPVFAHQKAGIDEGMIGKPLSARMSFLGGGSFQPGYRWRSDGVRSTGALGDLGSHLIDLTRWMFGEITNVSARISTQHDRKGVEPIPANDTALIDLVTHNGVCVSLFASSAALLGEEKARVDVQVLGSAGSLEAQLIFYGAEAGSRLLRRTADHQVKVLLSESYTQGSEPPDFVAVYRSESAGPRAFIDAIIEGRGAKPDFFDGLEAQRVIDAALRSNHKGHRIDI